MDRRLSQFCSLSITACALLIAPVARGGAYRCLSTDCSLGTSARPVAFRDRSWTLFISAFVGAPLPNNAAGLFTQPAVLNVGVRDGAVEATVFRNREQASLSAPVNAKVGDRVLLALTWDKTTGELRLLAKAGASAVSEDLVMRPAWAGAILGASTCDADIDGDGVVGPADMLALLASFGPCSASGACPADIDHDGVVGPSDQLALLAAWGPCPGGGVMALGATMGAVTGAFDTSFVGDIGPILLRDKPITRADFDAIAASDAFLAPVFLDTTGVGGNLTGVDGVLFAMAHGMPAIARPGEPITPSTVFQFDRLAGGRFMSIAANVSITGVWEHVSPYDEHGLSRSPLAVTLQDPPYVARPSPLIRQIATGAFTRQIRVMVHGNSRVARTSTDHGLTQSYSHGWVQNRPGDVVGWLLRPPLAPRGSGGWFGFTNWPLSPIEINTQNLSTSDFGRFGQNSVTTRDLGPGTVAGVWPGGMFQALAKPEADMRADEPIRAGVILLQYPGSSNTIVDDARAPKVDAAAVQTRSSTPVWLDTNRFTHVFTSSDAQQTIQQAHYLTRRTIDQTVLHLGAPVAANINVGDAVYGALSGKSSVSVVESITDNGDGTADVLLATMLAGTAAPGDALHFGPWGFTWIEQDLPPDLVNTWRGVDIINGAGGGPGPVVILGVSAYVPNKPGMVLSTFGAGGDGYADHLKDEIPGAARKMAELLQLDVTLFTPAQQNSTLDDMEAYLAQIRLGRPDIEVGLLGDAAFNVGIPPGRDASGNFTFWNAGFLSRARALGAVAVDGARGLRIGRFLDRVADGQMNDISHQSTRGAARQAEEWDRLLTIAALPAIGDVNGDGSVGPIDLLAVLASWGGCAPTDTDPCGSDFDRDGVVGPSDLLALLSAFGK